MNITRIILKAEKKIVGQENKSPWSPILHDAVRTVSIWRALLKQFKTKLSHQSQLKFLLQSMSSPIDTSWIDPADIQRNLRKAYRNLQQVRSNATKLRINHLLQRASAMNLANKSVSSKTIINIQKIEKTIKMWKKIRFLTGSITNAQLQTLDIPEDESIGWNEIKERKNLQFKTIDDPEVIEKLIIERNAIHLNQAEGTPLTIEPMISLIGTDSYTTFGDEILKGTANVSEIKSPTIRKYIQQLKKNEEILKSPTVNFISLEDYKSGFKKWKESTTTSPSGRHLGHHHSLLVPDGVHYEEEEQNFST